MSGWFAYNTLVVLGGVSLLGAAAMAAGRGAEVAEYCETDVAATWLLLLRFWQATGVLPADAARQSFSDFATYLEDHRAEAHLADHAEAAQRLATA